MIKFYATSLQFSNTEAVVLLPLQTNERYVDLYLNIRLDTRYEQYPRPTFSAARSKDVVTLATGWWLWWRRWW